MPGVPSATEEPTPSGRIETKRAQSGALSLRDAAKRSRADGKLADAFATLEAANHVSPGDSGVLSELVELATALDDALAAARHLDELASIKTGAKRADALLQLADLCYDKLDDAVRARAAMRAAAEALGSGTRRDSTLRLLANEAATHLAWDIAVDAMSSIATARRTAADHVQLATALVRAGRINEAVDLVESAVAAGQLPADSPLVGELRRERERRDEAELRPRTITPHNALGAALAASMTRTADRERLLAAHRESPDDPALLLALLAHLGSDHAQPALRREVLDAVADRGTGRAQAIALHELALIARGETGETPDPIRAAALWTKAHRVDRTYAPVWLPLADALAAADELSAARDLYEQVARSNDYEPDRRAYAAGIAYELGRDDSIVSGEIRAIRPADLEDEPPPAPIREEPSDEPSLSRARELADAGDVPRAIAVAERAAEAAPDDNVALELLEQLYLDAGDITAASEAIGRQLLLFEDDSAARAALWRRRAKLYRDALGRDAEAYRCLKEAAACSPADAEIAYQLRTAAMVRGEWGLVASLLYREIAAAATPRDRGALHLELAMIFDERLDDPSQAQVNYEQALAFDPSIPAVKAPLARRYEAAGRYDDAARLYDEAATSARAADRASLIADAARSRAAAQTVGGHADLAAQLERAESSGDVDAAQELAHQLWNAELGHAAAFRVLASIHRTRGDLPALTEITTVRANKAASPEERATAWLEVARLAEELAKLDQAARAYDLALIEDPGHVGALDARGALAFRLGDYATADLIYRDLSPGESVLGDDELALRRSIVAEQLGRDNEALVQAQAAAAASPGRRDVMMRVQELATRVGDLPTALAAARTVLGLVPLDDDQGQLATHFAYTELLREAGELDLAIVQLERITRDDPLNVKAIEGLADVHVARGDWPSATRYLYLLVPLAPTPVERAERLYRLGEAILVHLGDSDRADDVFLRASDLDPSHVPTLRRLLDVYWRADDPAALVEVAAELVDRGGLRDTRALSLPNNETIVASLGKAIIAAALVGDAKLAGELVAALDGSASIAIAHALAELVDRRTAGSRLALATASTAIADLASRGVLDLAQIRAASGSDVASALGVTS
jgi:tetratricopeptide (TPR) repeat protein